MKARRWTPEAVFAAVVGVVVLIAAAWSVAAFLLNTPMYEDASMVPSTLTPPAVESDIAPVERSRQIARTLVTRNDAPGLSVAVARDGAIVWAEGFGWADVEAKKPITPQTRYRLGALSKPVTAFAAALLHDRGRLDLDAPIQQYVPAYPKKQWAVTMRHLMGDVAGVHRPRGDNTVDSMPGDNHCTSVGDGVALLVDDPLHFEPGTQYRYSNWGWLLASAVIQGAAGEPFESFMTHRVFGPLGMERTTVAETPGLDDLPSNRQPVWILGLKVGVETDTVPDYSCLAGGGAFVSTPSDLVRFASAMMKPGLLKAETIATFLTPGRLASGTATTYALGWTVGSANIGGRQVRMISHRGSPRGDGIALVAYPDLGLAVAAASRVNSTDALAFAQQVSGAFSGDSARQ